MDILEHISVGGKTTMRIGGTARWYGDITSKEDVEFAVIFAKEHQVPLIVLGGGSNTIFSNDEVEALVVRIKAEAMSREGNRVTVQSGKILASLINELGEQGLDLSALTGIPGTIGGAIFGNAGQGPKGTWLDSYIVNVTAYIDGEWKTFSRDECRFRYRESIFKEEDRLKTQDVGQKEPDTYHLSPMSHVSPIIWEAQLELPPGVPVTIHNNVEALLKKRFETQPHLKTAGSCFKAIGGTPAWQLIDQAGLRGLRIGDIEISPKHANFLMNVRKGMYSDAKQIVQRVKADVRDNMEVEMRFIERDGSVAF